MPRCYFSKPADSCDKVAQAHPSLIDDNPGQNILDANQDYQCARTFGNTGYLGAYCPVWIPDDSSISKPQQNMIMTYFQNLPLHARQNLTTLQQMRINPHELIQAQALVEFANQEVPMVRSITHDDLIQNESNKLATSAGVMSGVGIGVSNNALNLNTKRLDEFKLALEKTRASIDGILDTQGKPTYPDKAAAKSALVKDLESLQTHYATEVKNYHVPVAELKSRAFKTASRIEKDIGWKVFDFNIAKRIGHTASHMKLTGRVGGNIGGLLSMEDFIEDVFFDREGDKLYDFTKGITAIGSGWIGMTAVTGTISLFMVATPSGWAVLAVAGVAVALGSVINDYADKLVDYAFNINER